MSHYVFAKLEITDFDWIEEYQEEVPKIITQYQGKLLARSTDIEVIEGDIEKPHVVLLVEFPTQEQAQLFYDSPEYSTHLEARLGGSKAEVLNFSGGDSIGK